MKIIPDRRNQLGGIERGRIRNPESFAEHDNCEEVVLVQLLAFQRLTVRADIELDESAPERLPALRQRAPLHRLHHRYSRVAGCRSPSSRASAGSRRARPIASMASTAPPPRD